MVDFKLNLDYVVKAQDRNESNGAACRDITLTDYLVTQALISKYPPPVALPNQVLVKRWGEIENKSERKTVGRIVNAIGRALLDAKETDEATAKLTQEQFEFLATLMDEWKAPSEFAGWLETVNSYCAEVKLAALEREKVAK